MLFRSTLTDATSGAALTFRKVGGGETASEVGDAMEGADEDAGGISGATGAGGGGSLAGSWQNQQGSTLQLNPDGSAILNGQRFRYTSDGSTLTLIGADGQLPFPYSLRGNTMTVQVQGQTVVYTRTGGSSGATACPCRRRPPETILLDVRLPGRDGLSAIPDLRALAPQAPVIVMTAFGDLDTAVRTVAAGAFDYLVKIGRAHV